MSAVVTETKTNANLDELKARLKKTWMTGNYDLFSRFMEKDAEQFFLRLGVAPGTRLLDVGCGAGQLALIAARRVPGLPVATLPPIGSRKPGLARPPNDLMSTLKREMPKRCRMRMASLTRSSVWSERCSRRARIWLRPNSPAFAGPGE